MSGRGGRGGSGGRGGFTKKKPGTVTIGGTECKWDLDGIELPVKPLDHFPKKSEPVLAGPPTDDERATLNHFMAVRDRIHEGPFYTILNDGYHTGMKRKANETAPTEDTLFNPFTDNQTYSAKYMKVRRRIPKLDSRPYVHELFPPELREFLDRGSNKRRVLAVTTKINTKTSIEKTIQAEEERTKEAEARAVEDEEDEEEAEEEEQNDEEKEEKLALGEEEDNWSAVSSDSEEADDDYNAEQYFDNGEQDDIDDGDPYENTYGDD